MGTAQYDPGASERHAWNAGPKVGTKRPLKPRQVWAIRFYLDQHRRPCDRALFDLALDSKLRGCDVVRLKIGDLVAGGEVRISNVRGKRKKPGLMRQHVTAIEAARRVGGGECEGLSVGSSDVRFRPARSRRRLSLCGRYG